MLQQDELDFISLITILIRDRDAFKLQSNPYTLNTLERENVLDFFIELVKEDHVEQRNRLTATNKFGYKSI